MTRVALLLLAIASCGYTVPCQQENTCNQGQVCAPSGHCEPAGKPDAWRCPGSKTWPAPECVRVR